MEHSKIKVRLVDKGYRKNKGLEFFGTYTQDSRITSIHILITIENLHNLYISQMMLKPHS